MFVAIGNRFIDPTFDENTQDELDMKRIRKQTVKIDGKETKEGKDSSKKKCC